MTLRHWCLLLAIVALPTTVQAHRLDEYLQATLVNIEPDEIHLQINLTPGVEVAEQVLDVIDRDRDGAIAPSEAAAYADLLQRDLAVRLDGRQVELALNWSRFRTPDEMRSGWGMIQLQFTASPASLASGRHVLSVDNGHFSSLGAYLFNAAQPQSTSVVIAKQIRNENQSSGEIEFTYNPPVTTPRATLLVAALAVLIAACAGAWWLRGGSPGSTTSR